MVALLQLYPLLIDQTPLSRDVSIVKVWDPIYLGLYSGISLRSEVYEYLCSLSAIIKTYDELCCHLSLGNKPSSKVQDLWATGIFVNEKDQERKEKVIWAGLVYECFKKMMATLCGYVLVSCDETQEEFR